MCFKIDAKHPKVKTASHNILCWKVLDYWLISPYQGFRYTAGKIVTIKAKLRPEPGLYRDRYIERGLHPFSDASKARDLLEFAPQIRFMYPAIIPKGAKFYYNSVNKELVSDKLAVFRDLKDAISACGQAQQSKTVIL